LKNKITAFELLRNTWMINEQQLPMYELLVAEIIAGRQIDVGMFGSLSIPDVPPNMALIVMSGILTKEDVCGAKGMRTMSDEIASASANPLIDSILIYTERCPGGSVDGAKSMSDVVREAANIKPVLNAVSGMSCSGGIFTTSYCTETYATSETDVFGCIGALATLGNPNSKLSETSRYITVISDLSPQKNIEFTNHDLYKERILNPMAKMFQDAVISGRGDRLKLDKQNVLEGGSYVATQALEYGLIDGIMPINKVIARASYLGRINKNKNKK
jgi:ClpP class serine protease